jgi:hypothetical protein
MKYMLMLRFNEGQGPEENSPEFAAEMAQWMTLNEELSAVDPSSRGIGLDSTDTATTVRTENDDFVITDGPFAETKEHLFSFYLIDVPDLDTALTFAKKMPCAKYGSVEIRPLSVHEQ